MEKTDVSLPYFEIVRSMIVATVGEVFSVIVLKVVHPVMFKRK